MELTNRLKKQNQYEGQMSCVVLHLYKATMYMAKLVRFNIFHFITFNFQCCHIAADIQTQESITGSVGHYRTSYQE